MKGVIGRFEIIINSLSKGLNYVGAAALMAIVILTCADVVMRYFGHPLHGSYDLVRFLAVVMIALSLANTQVQKGHISVDLVVSRLPKPARVTLAKIMALLGLGIFALLARQSCIFAKRLWISGEVSLTLETPLFPFAYIIALGAIILCLVLLKDFLK